MNEQQVSQKKSGFLPWLSPFRWVRWWFSWRIMRRWLFIGACFITFLLLLSAEENWRGKRAWEKYKQEQQAKGEKFDMADFIPPPVPDDQNFAMTPFLQKNPGKLFGSLFSTDPSQYSERYWTNLKQPDDMIWTNALRGGSNSPFASPKEAAAALLKAYEKFQPALDELQAASQRPYCRFKSYDAYSGDPFSLLLPSLALWKNITQAYNLRAQGELILGQHAAALADTKMMFYMADTLTNKPALIVGLVRLAMLNIAIQTVQDGLAAHQWTDPELVELQKKFVGTDLLSEYGAVMRSERAGSVTGIGMYANRLAKVPVLPRGWMYLNQLTLSRFYDEHVFPPVIASTHRVDAAGVDAGAEAATNEFRKGFHPSTVFARLLAPAVGGSARKFAAAQVRVDEAAVACALERYHLKNQKYPEKLDELVPQFVKAIPTDVFNGEPLKYHRTDDGQFTLYSVGWNGKDDDGKIPEKKKGMKYDPNAGDWVWGTRF